MEATKMAGLAFSGGGIRSAALCSGVLRRLLQSKGKVDYLSCVSGGGYTGTAFLEWKYRKEKKAKGSEEWHEQFFENMRQKAGYCCNWEKPCQGILDSIVLFFLVLAVTFIEPIVICGSYAFPLAFIIDYLFGKLLRAKVDCDHVTPTSSPSNPNATAQKIREHCLSRQGTVAFTKITLFSVLVVLFVIFYILSQKLSKKKSKYFTLLSIISFSLLSLTFLPFAINDFFIKIPLWSQAFIVVIGWVLWFVLPLLRDKTSSSILIYLYSYIIYWKVYEAKIAGVLFSIELFNKLLFASGFIIWFLPYLAQSRRKFVHVFNRWKLQRAFYSKESSGKGWLEILCEVVHPLGTCLERKRRQLSRLRDQRDSRDALYNDIKPAQKGSLSLADLRSTEPEYISNMTVHSWKENADSDTHDNVLTMSPTTIERLDRDRDSSTADPFEDKLSPQDIELSDAMATSAAAISGYDDNLQSLHLSTLFGLEMGASMISNLEAIKNEPSLMKLLPILINIVRGLPLIAVPAFYYSEEDEGSITVGVFTFFGIHLVLVLIGALADTGSPDSKWGWIARWFIVHVPFVRFAKEGLSIDNIGPMPPPVILLSDGGHLENLGILPLLKKQLKKIIVVDGGYYSNENEYGEDLLNALMLARRDLNCSFLGQGGRDVISDLLENFVKLHKPEERKKLHQPEERKKKEERKPRHFKFKVEYYENGHKVGEGEILLIRPRDPRKGEDSEAKTWDQFGLHLETRDWGNSPYLNEEDVDNLTFCCCACCNKKSCLSGLSEFLCHKFPNHSTANQFFTPLMFSAYHREGFRACVEAEAAEFLKDNHDISEV